MATGVAVAVRKRAGLRVAAESEEGRLVARCQEGDRQAQETLVRHCQDRVYRLAYRLLGHREEALDACQETLVAMLRTLPTFRGHAQFQTWLYRVTTNVCLMRRRHLKARTRLIAAAAAEPPQEQDPESAALRREAQEAVREHLRRLPAQFRAVVVLRELEGMSYEEIAGILRVPVGTVQSRLSRGRLLLRQVLLNDERITLPDRGGEKP